jgi:hydrogenase maturation protease
MIPVLVIGYGNPLRADDGAGRRAADALLDAWPADGVRVEAAHQLLVEMAASAAEAGFAVFIDAARDGAPGEVSVRALAPDPRSDDSLTHHLTPETLLSAARLWYGRAPEAVLVSVGGEDFGHGERLSPKVEAALPGLLDRVRGLVAARLEKTHA